MPAFSAALSLLSSVGTAFLVAGMIVFIVNVLWTLRQRAHGRAEPAPDDPWEGHSLEWATSSPPPRYNFTPEHPVPPVTGFAPLPDLRQRRQAEAAGEGSRP